MTLAAVDRLVHHATIFEMNVESYRRREALGRKKRGAGRPANYATTKNVGNVDAERQSTGDVAIWGIPSPGVTRDRGSWSFTLGRRKDKPKKKPELLPPAAADRACMEG